MPSAGKEAPKLVGLLNLGILIKNWAMNEVQEQKMWSVSHRQSSQPYRVELNRNKFGS